MKRVFQESLLGSRQAEPDVPGAERERQTPDQRAHFQGNDGLAGLHPSDPGPQQTSTTGTLTRTEGMSRVRTHFSTVHRDDALIVSPPPPTATQKNPCDVEPITD